MRSTVFEPQFREGTGEPLLLLHGGSINWTNWQHVVPELSGDYDVLAPSLGGHAGGAPLPDGPVTVDSYADSIAAVMDTAGWGTAHIAGNSLGGWTAMELARRGRARSVVALSPAGGWPDDPRAMARLRRWFVWNRRRIQLTRSVAPLALKSGVVRRISFKDLAVHGERIAPAYAVQMRDIVLANDIRLLQIFDSAVQEYPDPGVPVLIAWSEYDRLLPMPAFSDPWRAAAPHAEFRVLPGVGHVPMYDDPRLVADAIRDWISQSR